MERGTFGYPLKQRWFANDTQMANEPCFVDADGAVFVGDTLTHRVRVIRAR